MAESTERIGPRVREACREAFREHRLLKRILPDIDYLLGISNEVLTLGEEADSDPARPEPLWAPPDRAAPTAPPADVVDSEAHRLRHQRAQEGLRSGWTVRLCAPDVWNVVTRADSPGYTIRQVEKAWQCDCPDFAQNGLGMCKHTAAVELTQAAQESEGGA